ncbi:hypothetical protein BD310DRAFT_1041390 [Dichomitus squalens]|uniref:Uncharacterized protein n=1 Tax=Dichomitus squalens TaxID=114155 RepID=A0A4Q9PLJ8_9APHY|nr:hypothetical protein BD310DRAFT_1041390 [Dichomitus squalens]
MANVTSSEMQQLFNVAAYGLVSGNQALGALPSTLLNTGLYGVLTLTTCVAGILLLPRAWRDLRNTALLLATAAMYAGTTVYFALRIRHLVTDATAVYSNVLLLYSDLRACSSGAVAPGADTPACDAMADFGLFAAPSRIDSQFCAGTAALTVNAVLGNAILSWRACVAWPRRRLVPLVLISLVLATCALGIADAATACRGAAQEDPLELDGPSVGTLFMGKSFGLAASALALATNVITTSLVGFRIWQRRAAVAGHISALQSARSRVWSTLALAVELGIVYCVVWAVMLAAAAGLKGSIGFLEDVETGYEEIVYTKNPSAFIDGFWVFDLGAMTALTAIYPLAVLIILALDASHCESGFEYTEADTTGFKNLTDGSGGAGRVFSPTQWRHKFLLSPEPAKLGGGLRGSKGSVEAFALQQRPHAAWEGVEGETEVGKGDVL